VLVQVAPALGNFTGFSCDVPPNVTHFDCLPKEVRSYRKGFASAAVSRVVMNVTLVL
jgi:hypothetical protein